MREEKARDQRKVGQKIIPTPGTDIFIDIFQSGTWDARDMLKNGRMCKKGGLLCSTLEEGQRRYGISPILSRVLGEEPPNIRPPAKSPRSKT